MILNQANMYVKHDFIFRMLINMTVGCIFGGYLLATALHSPDMLFGAEVGGSLTVID
jgi:hypothetical protein